MPALYDRARQPDQARRFGSFDDVLTAGPLAPMCDCSASCPAPGAVLGSGIVGTVRYATRFGFTRTEYEDRIAAGEQVVVVMEWGTQPALRGAAGGLADAEAAEGAVGSWYDGAIYYVLEDPNRIDPSQWPLVDAYLDAVRPVNPHRLIGGYGGLALVQHEIAAARAVYGWVVGPWGGTSPAVHMEQIIGGVPSPFSGQIDIDLVLEPDFGQSPRPRPPKPKEQQMYLIRNTAGMVCTFSGTHKRLVPNPAIMALYTAAGAPVVQLPDAEFAAIPDGDMATALESWLRQEFSATGQELHDRIVQAATVAISQSGVALTGAAAAAVKANVPAAVLTALAQHDPAVVADVLAGIKQSLPSLQGPKGDPGPAGPSYDDSGIVAAEKAEADAIAGIVSKEAQVSKDLGPPSS